MRILSLVNVELDNTLGSGKIILAWTNGLRSLGHDLTIITPSYFHRPLFWNAFRRFKIRLDTLSLKKVVLSGQFDIVEFYGAEFGLLINYLASIPRMSRPLLVHHSNGCELLMNKYENSKYRRRSINILHLMRAAQDKIINRWNEASFCKVDCFVSICRADIDFLAKSLAFPSERSAVIEPGLDNFYLNSDWRREKRAWILSLGTWIDRKGVSTLVKVITYLLATYPCLEYHAIGASDAKSVLLASFDPIYHQRIFVHSHRPCLADLLTQARLLLFPSLYESFGLATPEALACGCNVVVTPTGFASSIRDGVDGFVCSFDDHESMIQRCELILNDEFLGGQLRISGRQRIAQMTWSNQVAKLGSLYIRWLDSF